MCQDGDVFFLPDQRVSWSGSTPFFDADLDQYIFFALVWGFFVFLAVL
jgi:hypothetical protein